MKDKSNLGTLAALGFIFIVSISHIGNGVERTQSIELMLAYFAAFSAYGWLCSMEHSKVGYLISLGAITRVSLLFSLPNLSDDFYRFLWDGHISNASYDPFSLLPREALELSIAGVNPQLFGHLNSPDYYTVYPPTNQLVFSLATFLGQQNELLAVNVIRSMIIVADFASFWLIFKLLGGDHKRSFWFLLNPMIILEFTGNLHFEAFTIFFILLAVWFVKRNDKLLSGVAIGVAASIKLLPIIFLPAFAWRSRWKTGIVLSVLALSILLGSLAPVWIGASWSEIASSLSLYYQSFEFNASIYYLLREVGFWFKGYNIIQTLGPRMAILAGILIIIITIRSDLKKNQLAQTLLYSLTIYLLMSTTVHPWYILPLVPLGLLAGHYYPIVWSLMAFTTYLGYTDEGYHLSMLWIFAEYGFVLLIGFIELKRRHAFS
ncbi:MAG: DUF2029 domain-containing protein [Cyclobacteriaceae bacterium]